MPCSVYLLGQSTKPSWCLQVRIIVLNPAFFNTVAHWSTSTCVGLKTAGCSSPYPHSLSVNVLVVKCKKAFISISCHSICAAVGNGITGAGAATGFFDLNNQATENEQSTNTITIRLTMTSL